MRTNAAQAASAFITESKTILTTSPGAPEKAAIPRAIPLGLKTRWDGGCWGGRGAHVGSRGAGGRPPGTPARVTD